MTFPNGTAALRQGGAGAHPGDLDADGERPAARVPGAPVRGPGLRAPPPTATTSPSSPAPAASRSAAASTSPSISSRASALGGDRAERPGPPADAAAGDGGLRPGGNLPADRSPTTTSLPGPGLAGRSVTAGPGRRRASPAASTGSSSPSPDRGTWWRSSSSTRSPSPNAPAGTRLIGYDGAIPGVSTFNGTIAGGAHCVLGVTSHSTAGCGSDFSTPVVRTWWARRWPTRSDTRSGSSTPPRPRERRARTSIR